MGAGRAPRLCSRAILSDAISIGGTDRRTLLFCVAIAARETMKRPPTRAPLLLATSALLACKNPTASPAPSTTPAIAPADVPSLAPPPVAPPADTGVAAGPITPIAAPIGEELVRRLRLSVRVSSSAGASTSADKMTDGDLATAWNSRSGDLVGAWFEVTVPDGVTVSSFAMTAGFTRMNGRNDLFVMNHRVERVRVDKDGEELGEFALDPEARTLQTFPLRYGAGTYRFTITAARAGTRASWRELCVSEFTLYGTAPEGMVIPSDPDAGERDDSSDAGASDTDTSVSDAGASNASNDGSVAAPEAPPALQPSAPETLTAEAAVEDVAAFCTAMQRRNFRRAACNTASAELGRAACFCGQMPGPNAPPTFTTTNRQASLQRPASPFLGAYFMARAPNPNDAVQCDLLVRTPAGLFPFVGIAECGPGASTGGERPSLHVRRMRAIGETPGPAELTIEWSEAHDRRTSRRWTCTGSWTARCTVDSGNVPTCTKVLSAAETCRESDATGS